MQELGEGGGPFYQDSFRGLGLADMQHAKELLGDPYLEAKFKVCSVQWRQRKRERMWTRVFGHGFGCAVAKCWERLAVRAPVHSSSAPVNRGLTGCQMLCRAGGCGVQVRRLIGVQPPPG